jgi:hypothetical protein
MRNNEYVNIIFRSQTSSSGGGSATTSNVNDGSGNNKKGKKRTSNNSSSSSTNHSSKVTVTSNNARNQSNHKSSKNNAKNVSNDNNHGVGNNSVPIGVSSNLSTTSSNVHNPSTNDGTHTATATTQSQSTIVKLSPAPSSTGSARTSSPIVNVTVMKKYRDEPSTSRTPETPFNSSNSIAPAASIGGGLKFAFEPQGGTAQQQQQQQQPQHTPAGLVVNTNALHHTMKESPPSSPGSEASARKRRKGTANNSIPAQLPSPHHNAHHLEAKREREDKDAKASLLQNGAIPVPTHHMLGNTLNTASNAAKSMAETLTMEIEAHSIYEQPPLLTGPQYPGRKESVRLLLR